MAILDQIAFDEHGYMRDPNQWNADVGEAIAGSLGLEGLGHARVRVIEFLREHYLSRGAVPPAEEAQGECMMRVSVRPAKPGAS